MCLCWQPSWSTLCAGAALTAHWHLHVAWGMYMEECLYKGSVYVGGNPQGWECGSIYLHLCT